jgi:hypothetical protein
MAGLIGGKISRDCRYLAETLPIFKVIITATYIQISLLSVRSILLLPKLLKQPSGGQVWRGGHGTGRFRSFINIYGHAQMLLGINDLKVGFPEFDIATDLT